MLSKEMSIRPGYDHNNNIDLKTEAFQGLLLDALCAGTG